MSIPHIFFPGFPALRSRETDYRSVKQAVQVLCFSLSIIAAFLLRFDFYIPQAELGHLALSIPILIAVKWMTFRWFRLDHGWWRFVSVHDVMKLTMANVVGSALSGAAIAATMVPGYPRSVILLDFIVCLLATASVRVGVRLISDSGSGDTNGVEGKPVVIYGAGVAGVMLSREIRSNQSLGYKVEGFVDDNASKKGIQIMGLPVLGSGRDLSALVARRGIKEILIAVPSASGPEIARILDYCRCAGVKFKTVPSFSEMIRGRALASQIREVRVEDLLGRRPVHLETEQIRTKLQGKTILVTGAGGSIGSELCRQIAQYKPEAIIGYEIAENALFHLDREMRKSHPDLAFYGEVGSIQNPSRVSEVLARYKPSIIYHAAAYKHVPIMEEHAFEAIENNVFGTNTIARLAAEHKVQDFVTISSDKAVRPTSVMGATKRMSELIMFAMQNGSTRFMGVRFGNVLESNGSVVPIFKQQIAEGGPVTITHPEMSRYFMTIAEASQLVLQASSMGKGGEIFVLDMGSPVKILDLANNLILLSGLRPGEDIRIEFTSMRPGEKLHEELGRVEENMRPTRHEKISVYNATGHSAEQLNQYMDHLQKICKDRDLAQLVVTLKEIMPDYKPSAQLLRRAIPERQEVIRTRHHVLQAGASLIRDVA